jgi:hypothetical protein
MSNNLKASALIGLSLALSGVSAANAATLTETDTLSLSADGSNPTQNPIGTPIALLFIGAALIFIPTVFGIDGTFGSLELTAVQTGSNLGGPFPAGTQIFSSPMPLSAATLQAFSGGTTVAQLENDNLDLTPVGGTPLPATLPLFATGLGALGLLGWRRKRKARVSLLEGGLTNLR